MSMTERSKAGLNHEYARTDEQRKLMQQIENDGVCPFCADHFKKYHPKPILKETDYWFVTENISPYEGATIHLIFVYKPRHITTVHEIEDPARIDFFSCVEWAVQTFDIKGGTFFMRFGDTAYNKSSVEHLHAQLLTGVHKDEGTDKIRQTLGWKK